MGAMQVYDDFASAPATRVGARHGNDAITGLVERPDFTDEVVERKIALIGFDDQNRVPQSLTRLDVSDPQSACWKTGTDQLVTFADRIAFAVTGTGIDAPNLDQRIVKLWSDGSVHAAVYTRQDAHDALIERDLWRSPRLTFMWVERTESLKAGRPARTDTLLHEPLPAPVGKRSIDCTKNSDGTDHSCKNHLLHNAHPWTDLIGITLQGPICRLLSKPLQILWKYFAPQLQADLKLTTEAVMHAAQTNFYAQTLDILEASRVC